jgi:N-acetylglucosaminyldiphosphoundecaprenol N-acetyl-beta-D-mannosaminyltransferase
MDTKFNEGIPKIGILGVQTHILDKATLHSYMENIIMESRRALVLNVNVNCLNLAFDKKWLRDFLNEAEIVFCDGAGVMLGARILGHKIPERITYADWMWELAEFAESRNFSFYFLGAKPGTAQKAAERIHNRYRNIRILGYHHGYFDKSKNSYETKALIHSINKLKPNILVLGFGMPTQERWLMENWDRIDTNIALSGGAVFDYISGDLRRAPEWMTDHSLEWLGRLIIEPKRLWKRYLLGNPLFLWRVFMQRLNISDKSLDS